MKHVDAFRQLGDVERSVREPRVNPQLRDTRADGWHRLPVGWLKPILYQAQLASGYASSVSREATNIV